MTRLILFGNMRLKESLGQSRHVIGASKLACVVGLGMILVGCSDSIKCWPFCSSSSSGVATITETVATTTETTCTDAASITVTYPTGGEKLGGGTHILTWTKSCAVEKVRIDVYDNNSLFVRWVGDKQTETEIEWEIQEANGLYRIKVTSVSDTSVYDYSDYFQIKTHNDEHL